uniref:Uncharacterized protein n=1 Tax=Trypanosoma vivax (strain Y486) TaxID=1055687 RepID=G0TY10_TRYVY|nr:hypothetical protein TVY486_0701920 [Trypanosoma vivax Y486]
MLVATVRTWCMLGCLRWSSVSLTCIGNDATARVLANEGKGAIESGKGGRSNMKVRFNFHTLVCFFFSLFLLLVFPWFVSLYDISGQHCFPLLLLLSSFPMCFLFAVVIDGNIQLSRFWPLLYRFSFSRMEGPYAPHTRLSSPTVHPFIHSFIHFSPFPFPWMYRFSKVCLSVPFSRSYF